MPSLFQRLFQTEEPAPVLNVPTDGLESAIIDAMRGNLNEGLIPAKDLPSAAKELAELFPSEPAPGDDFSGNTGEAECSLSVAEGSVADAAITEAPLSELAVAEGEEGAIHAQIVERETLNAAETDGAAEAAVEQLPDAPDVTQAYLCAFDEDFGLSAPSAHDSGQVDDEGRQEVKFDEQSHAEAGKHNFPGVLAKIGIVQPAAALVGQAAEIDAEARALEKILETEAALAELEAQALAASAQTLTMLTGSAPAAAEETPADLVVAGLDDDAVQHAEQGLGGPEIVQKDEAAFKNDAVVDGHIAVENEALNGAAFDDADLDQEASDHKALAAAAELQHESSAEASPAAAPEFLNLSLVEEPLAQESPAEDWRAEEPALEEPATISHQFTVAPVGRDDPRAADIISEDFPDDNGNEAGEHFDYSPDHSLGKALGERLANAFVHSDARSGDSAALSPERSDSDDPVISPIGTPHDGNPPVDTFLFEGGTAEAVVASASMVALDALAIEAIDPVETPEQSPARASTRTRDWAFEEKLAAHLEWIESQGLAGKKAEFSDTALESMELIGVNFRSPALPDAILKEADLLLADLRDACLVRTNLEEACLVGANLEGANLEGANLRSAMGLVPRQLAGTNLRDASVPALIAEFVAKGSFARASEAVYGYFLA